MLNLPNFKYQNQKFLLSITRFVHFHGLTAAAAIIGLLVMVGSIANAQTISSAVGLPDMDPSSPWYGVCSTNPDPPAAPGPNATSQLKACSAANPSECLQRVTIPMNNFPNATCNDGSPGIFYVRPGAGEDANKWIIHTQGGGSCGDYIIIGH